MDSQVLSYIVEASTSSAAETSADKPNNEAQRLNAPTDASNLTDKSEDMKDAEKIEETAVSRDNSQSSTSSKKVGESNVEGKGAAISHDSSTCGVSNISVHEVKEATIMEGSSQPSAATSEMKTTEGKEKNVFRDNSKSSTDVGATEGKDARNVGNVSNPSQSVSQSSEVNKERIEVSDVASGSSPSVPEKKKMVTPSASNVKSLKEFSFKELEEAFTSALNLPEVTEIKKNIADPKSVSSAVPHIKITEASEFQKGGVASRSLEAGKDTSDVDAAVGKEINYDTGVGTTQQPHVDSVNDRIEDQTATTSSRESGETEMPCKNEGSRASFYISPTEAPSELRNRSLVNSAESRAQASERSEAPTCLGSRGLHAAIFLACIVVASLGFALYGTAQNGQVPEIFEPIGLSTTIIAGIIGAFSLLYFTILGCFSNEPFFGYEMMGNAQTVLSMHNAGYFDNFRDESWSSETERAFRIQNGMSSTRTSEILARREVENQTSVDSTDKLKAGISEVLESMRDTISSEEGDVEAVEMQTPANEGEDNSKSNSESVSAQSGTCVSDEL